VLADLWKGLGDQLGQRWASVFFYPAFAYWAGGLLLWELSHRNLPDDVINFGKWLDHLPAVGQVGLLVLVAVAITASGYVVDSVTYRVLRFLEGYGLPWIGPVSEAAIKLRNWWRNRDFLGQKGWLRRYDELAAKPKENRTASESAEWERLDELKLTTPASPMPTRLGELLRTAELRPWWRYGLDAVACWAQLWLVIPKEARAEISEARSALNAAVRLWTWSVLFLAWTPFVNWAAPIGLLLGWYTHRLVMTAAMSYGEVMAAAYDVFRFKLYESVHWPMPKNTNEERNLGLELTKFLRRGSFKALPLAQTRSPVQINNAE